jgi:hypothetical protein
MRMPVRRLSRRPRRSPLRVITYFALGFIAVVALVVVAAFELINPNAYKPQIEAAAERATGRALTLSGPITIVSYTRPTIAISDVAFANMQGGSKPQMLTVRSIEADIGWRALLQGRVTIPRLVLDRPELLLETDKQGHGNWEIAAPGKAAPAAAAAPQAGSQVGPGARPAFSIQTLHVKDAQVTWHDGRTGRVTVLSIPRLSLTAASLASPVTVTADITAQTHSMQLTGQIGPLERLFGATATDDKAWPVDLHATTQGAQLALSGAFPATRCGCRPMSSTWRIWRRCRRCRCRRCATFRSAPPSPTMAGWCRRSRPWRCGWVARNSIRSCPGCRSRRRISRRRRPISRSTWRSRGRCGARRSPSSPISARRRR